jgi:predicted small lipoprotein YifL
MLLRIAAVGALAASLSLAGCGRKSGLDAPPGGALTDPSAGNGNAVAPDGRPAQAPTAPPPNRHTFLDWLID